MALFGDVADLETRAVHVSVAGYLATAGRALPVGDARTMLAGWDPDATGWLTDVLSPGGPPAGWAADDRGRFGWLPAGEPRLSSLPPR